MTSPKLLLNLPVTPGPNRDGGKVVVSPSGYLVYRKWCSL
jgi:hypothetical protein